MVELLPKFIHPATLFVKQSYWRLCCLVPES